MSRLVKCPTCGKPVPWTSSQRWRPFCSERCKLIDLGAWAAEDHRIEGEHADSYPPRDVEREQDD